MLGNSESELWAIVLKRNVRPYPVESGHRCQLAPHSLIEVGGMRLLFLPNPTLVRTADPEPY